MFAIANTVLHSNRSLITGIRFLGYLVVICVQSFKHMVGTCLLKDPSKRPYAKKLLKHSFFKQARSSDYISRTLLEGLPTLGDRIKDMKVNTIFMLLIFGSIYSFHNLQCFPYLAPHFAKCRRKMKLLVPKRSHQMVKWKRCLR